MTLRINGRTRRVSAPESAFLIDLLRDNLTLTGSKYACGMGECGACTVLLDGAPVYACLLLAADAEGHEVTTIEGLGAWDQLHPLQEAFAQAGGVQCGFCTPGMILAAKALLDELPNPSEAQIREALSGNLCRCTGYTKIVDAVLAASGRAGE
jgi:carbon-monoxide dehydrogenase small subunit